MADSLLDLGTGIPVLRHSVNWEADPGYEFDFSRNILEFDGTATEIEEITPDKPQRFEFQMLIRNKAQEFALLNDFASLRGRWGRFWLLLPVNLFTLNSNHSAGISNLTVKRNDFEFMYRGFERLFILLLGGDALTRKVSNVTVDEVAGTMQLSLANPTDRVLNVNEVTIMSFALLVRFDIDELNIDYTHDGVGQVTLQTVELVKEYPA